MRSGPPPLVTVIEDRGAGSVAMPTHCGPGHRRVLAVLRYLGVDPAGPAS